MQSLVLAQWEAMPVGVCTVAHKGLMIMLLVVKGRQCLFCHNIKNIMYIT